MAVDMMTTVQRIGRRKESLSPFGILQFARVWTNLSSTTEPDRSRVRLESSQRMRGYFVRLAGASLTFTFVVASEERERQSWMVRITQS